MSWAATLACLALGLSGCVDGFQNEVAAAAATCQQLPRDRAAAPHGPLAADAPSSVFYGADAIQDLTVEIHAADWDALLTYKALKIKHVIPATFVFEGERIESAGLRLKGNVNRWKPTKKNQFVIRFDFYDGKGRFRGLRRLNLDHEHVAPIRNKLGMRVFEDAGVVGPRVGIARLFINTVDADSADSAYPQGYYGVYENIEVVDDTFLARHFAAPGGNLYKHGNQLKNSAADPPDLCDLALLGGLVESEALDGDHAAFFETLSTYVDMERLLSFAAAESALALGDNYWAGGNNYFLYNDPERAFVFVPWDVDDTASAVSPPEADPHAFPGVVRLGAVVPKMWTLVLQNPTWRAAFDAELLRVATTVYEPLASAVAGMCAQVRDADLADPHRTHLMDEFDADCVDIQQRIEARVAFLKESLHAP